MVAIRLNFNVFIIVFLLTGFVFDFSWAADAPVPKSGQTTSYGTRDDGALQKGAALPPPRFSDLGDGTVLDTLTSLIWMTNANCWGAMNWSAALTKITDLNNGQTTCSGYGGHDADWRLPNRNELESLIDYGHSSPSLPSSHPFSGVQTYSYWSSTTYAGLTSNAWSVYLYDGNVYYNSGKAGTNYVWPVRGGQ